MGKIIYVRHGQASLFSDNYDQLSDLGKLQSGALGKYFHIEKIQFTRIFLGPLVRHQETLDAIINAYPSLKNVSVEKVEELREHQGYTILKAILPDLMVSDDQIRKLTNLPFSNKKEQIKHHIRIFDHFAKRWVRGEFQQMIPCEFQQWQDFTTSALKAFKYIESNVGSGENALVVTSGGPKSIAMGHNLGLNHEKILELSSMIYNSSYTLFLNNGEKSTLSSFNNIPHLIPKDHRTLV